MNVFLKWITLLAIFTSLSACKLQVMVPEGGSVQSTISGACPELTVCVFEVEDTNFSATFTASPYAGWDFLRWNSGGGFFCADQTDPACVLSNVALAGNPGADAIIASKVSFYIQPVFQQRNEPITDFMTVAGFDIPQPDIFINLTWNDIAIVCPLWNNGICDGILKGFDMTGWTWMDWQTMNFVFNSYGVTPPLPLVPPNLSGSPQVNSAWAPAFFAAGWRPTDFPTIPSPGTELEGFLRSTPLASGFGSVGRMVDFTPITQSDLATSGASWLNNLPSSAIGAWFHRPATP